MTRDGRISLMDDLQFKWFNNAMDTLKKERLNLTDYDMRFLRQMEDAFDMFGRGMSVTRKQMEYLKQVAWDFEKGA